ncbi:Arylsulfatase [Anaerohalosphaera lusitana]|uniref:Arylsulfatase n=1 Tax=Anaerohalosphaera lusitana TaxID=1936003 RepID=A0A1U9NIL8_9BACT|nr:sulfatase-like hydrolase/transferase [Anaerohalosphaera lusitana]AQT67574.1 Arylsulfatase [Anaerohalosphaera lusitana]
MLNRRSFLKLAGVSLASAAVPSLAKAAEAGKPGSSPNIVLIYMDDMGYADPVCYGGKGYSTPNIDRLAKQGMLFTDFHVPQPVCSASRASLLTGCYSNRVSIEGALFPDSKKGLNPEEETIAEILKKRNYKTGMAGKWHLGHHREFLPLQHGFDEYLGLPYSNDMWPVDFNGNPAKSGWKKDCPPLPLIEDNEQVDTIDTLEDQDTLTTRYTERAVKFINENKRRPFFFYLAHTMTHVPLGVSEKFKGKSEQGMYGDVMMEIDWSVGQVMKALENNGLEEDTLVIFTSDNGPWLNFGNHAGSAEPLREGKQTTWEGGCRVSCIMRWPGQIPADSECDKLASTLDILPTIAEITGAPLPEKKIDGVSILSLLKGDENANPRKHLCYFYQRRLCAVREGNWKLVFPHTYQSYEGVEPGMDGHWGPRVKRKAELALYDLKNDIEETEDVKDEHPEVVKHLQKFATKARAELGDRLKNVEGSEVRPPGLHKQSK